MLTPTLVLRRDTGPLWRNVYPTSDADRPRSSRTRRRRPSPSCARSPARTSRRSTCSRSRPPSACTSRARSRSGAPRRRPPRTSATRSSRSTPRRRAGGPRPTASRSRARGTSRARSRSAAASSRASCSRASRSTCVSASNACSRQLICARQYHLVLLPPKATGFAPAVPDASAPLLSIPVQIGTANPPGVVPRSSAPPDYVPEKEDEGSYANTVGMLENGNQRFMGHHHMGA
jgi:hypothetical protein